MSEPADAQDRSPEATERDLRSRTAEAQPSDDDGSRAGPLAHQPLSSPD
jgi:hypothetical protein